jgi:hypothetical protein
VSSAQPDDDGDETSGVLRTYGDFARIKNAWRRGFFFFFFGNALTVFRCVIDHAQNDFRLRQIHAYRSFFEHYICRRIE